MSPLVAGTRPAKSGMEAQGPSPSRRHDPSIVKTIMPMRSHNDSHSSSSDWVSPGRPANDLGPSAHLGIHLPAHGHLPRAPAAGGFAVSPAPSGRHNLLSVSIISMTEHHLLHPSTDDSKPGPGRRTHLTHGPLAGCPELCRSPPPALYARDPRDDDPLTSSGHPDRPDRPDSRRRPPLAAGAPELRLLEHHRARRHLARLQVLPQRHQQLAGHRHDPHFP
jgi:hypothetical protein